MDELSLFHGPNAGYAAEQYEEFLKDPQSVDAETRLIFNKWKSEGGSPVILATTTSENSSAITETTIETIVRAAKLARLIREAGHLAATIDPLDVERPGYPGLFPEAHGLTDGDLANLPSSVVGGPCAAGTSNCLEAIKCLRSAYTGSVGYEDDHIQEEEESDWLREAAESRRFFEPMSAETKVDLLKALTHVEVFEQYLHTTFVGKKRFSIEGADMVVPMLEQIIEDSGDSGLREVVIGMAHRGRLNVLAHTLNKPLPMLLQGFLDSRKNAAESESGSGSTGYQGDVKYHLGYIRDVSMGGEQSMPVTLAPNPSHLEYVNPVAMGRARAAQEDRNQPGAPVRDAQASLNVTIHGDAAFPGQGVVAETLNLSRLGGYSVGGTIHIIINNQVGFTTLPSDSRSTTYASDLAKGFEIPIVHVNADDPEACIAVTKMAFAYRQKFGKDFLIDLVAYRRYGHNESDEPAFTQPKMYAKIRQHPTVRKQWEDKIVSDGATTAAKAKKLIEDYKFRLDAAKSSAADLTKQTHGLTGPKDISPVELAAPPTGVSGERLDSLNEQLLTRPEGFVIDSKLDRILSRRRQAINEAAIDWGHAETLAYATIIQDGTPVRLTGQDSERGTFGHRHVVVHNPETGDKFCSLQALDNVSASFTVVNSSLSESSVLGFEYGYAVHASEALVLWEAQFGDFGNSAQVIIDQFIVSGIAKWEQSPGLVMLLPHGYEGAGPEHSSGRLERFLQLAADDNIRVVNCTNAAQFYHVLRRQALFLKTKPRPLIVMTPKSLLREPKACCSREDLEHGRFQTVMDDPRATDRAGGIRRLIFCTGKIYVDLIKTPDFEHSTDVAAIRIEELYPFPLAEIRDVIARYPNAEDYVWLQEEPKNMGAWFYIYPRLNEVLLRGLQLRYVGRAASASTAAGTESAHFAEQARILSQAVSWETESSLTRSKGTNVH